MSDQGPEYFDDGSERWPLEGGGYVAFGPDLQPVEAVDEYGDPIDHSQITHPVIAEADDAYEYDEDDRLAELQAQIAELEQRVENPPAYDVRSPIPGLTEEEVQDRLETTLGRVEEVLHRSLTQREAIEVADRALSDGHADMVAAAGALRAEGRLRSYDSGNPALDHEARTAHMVELLGDADGTNPDAETGQPQRQAEDYDVSTHQGRVDRALDVMHGYDDTADTSYDSRTFEAEEYE